MPGTIQVTVLEFKGVSNSSKPSAKSLKVSMGKRQYQTWDKGEFSFPISKIREDLVVTLLDAGGNEIAHADIRTMQVIEKGSWDEVFSINGGGNVHMKLQFVLSDEERDRIRIMRESAMKKKLETNPKSNLKLSENEQKLSDSPKGIVEIDALSSRREASQAGSSSNSATSSSVLQTAVPNTTDGSQSAPSSPPRGRQLFFKTTFSEKNSLVPSNSVDPVSRNPEKSPNNVRKMISAFENTQIQEVKSLKKAQSVPYQLNRFRKEGLLDTRESMHAEKTSLRNFSAELAGNSKQTTVSEKAGIVSNVKGEKESDILDRSADASKERISEIATGSGRVTEGETSQETVNCCESSPSVAKGIGSGIRGTGLKSSSSNEIAKSIESYHSAQSTGMWIFPDNTGRLCITTAGRRMTGHLHRTEAKTRQEEKASDPKGLDKKNVGSSPDDSTNGLVRQVIKIAVVVGFGVLVLLTRQKEPRKKRREENDNVFPIEDYVD